MASHWVLPDAADDRVLSFEELAAELARGTVQWTDRVMCVESREVLPASEVLGLRQAVNRIVEIPQQNASRPAEPQKSVPLAVAARSGIDAIIVSGQRANSVIALLVSGAAGLSLTGVLVCEQFRRWQKYPIPADSPRSFRPWWFPVIGPVTWIEFWFLCLDVLMVCIVVGGCLEGFMRRRTSRSG